jgi:hypothetical protein
MVLGTENRLLAGGVGGFRIFFPLSFRSSLAPRDRRRSANNINQEAGFGNKGVWLSGNRVGQG